MITRHKDIEKIAKVLHELKAGGKILLAYLYGSFASASQHVRSDIDLAIYMNTQDDSETMEVTDRILMATDRQVGILRLDDEEESPFLVQRALNGIPLVEPDTEILYAVAHRALHEAETIRFRRAESAA